MQYKYQDGTFMKKTIILTASVFCLISGTAFASHPLISDDAGTLGKGAVQVELNGEIGTDKETVNGSTIKTDSSQIATTFGYGLTDKVDLNLGIARPWGSSEEAGITNKDAGSVDFSFGAKWQVYEKDGYSIALKPTFGYSYAVNAPDNNYTTSFGAAVVLTKELQPLAFHINLGYTYNDYSVDSSLKNSIWNFSFATVYELRKNTKLVADIGFSSNPEQSVNEMPAFGLLGAIYTINKTIDASIGAKFGLTKPETDVTGLFGITLKF